MYRSIFALLFSFGIFFNSCTPSSWYTPVFEETEQTLFDIRADQEYKFGYLTVPENRSVKGSRMIKLPVFIFKSRSENPAKDPIIYTVGGPGSTTMPSAQYMAYYQYLNDRDFILIEQRGTQYAQPHLSCPEWSEALYKGNQPYVDEEEKNQLLEDAAEVCRNRLISEDVDLNGYNTNEIAADIEDLRTLLNIEEYNLLTISYSTKIAQVLLRDYPDPIRSVVMDSPLPLEVSYDEESVQNLLEVIQQTFAKCESSVNCNARFPNIQNRFFSFLNDISSEPMEVAVEDPNTGVERIFLLKGKDLVPMIASAPASDIPFEVAKVLAGDLSSIRYVLSGRLNGAGPGNGIGMRLSVWCAEELPFASREVISEESIKYPQIEGLSPAVFAPEICDIWNVESASAKENEFIRSPIPVLIINGELDPNTPSKWGEKLWFNLSFGFHKVFPGWGHTPTTNWGNQCAMEMANEFFYHPWDEPQTECFTEIDGIEFRLE